MEDLLQAWKLHCDNRDTVAMYRNGEGKALVETKQSNLIFWKLCSKWGEHQSYSREFCQIVEQFQIEKLQVRDFIETIMEENHVNECELCRKSVCQRFLDNIEGNTGISVENCLILKDLANCYNREQIMQRLTDYIVENRERVFIRLDFNRLVPPDDFIEYTEHLKCTEMSENKFSIIASWIRFSPEREDVFPKLFQDKPLTKVPQVSTRWFLWNLFLQDPSVFKLEDVLFIKTLSRKYSCYQLEKEADEFMVRNFPSSIQLPESMQLLLKDLILYLQNPRSYGTDPSKIWDFIVKWVNYDPENRKEEFSAIFQALRLDGFSYQLMRETIRTCELVKESAECLSCLMDFILRNSN